mmetsp:Transcript_6083/g.13615  ORF Transcript_6083/g.13615 Transcript_6083/m.13615 type:complete len:533 (+) Transcript_6083:548-2146(+)
MGDDVWPRWGSLATHRRKEIEDKDTQVNDSPGLIYLTSENLNPPLEEDYYDDHGEEEDTDPVSAKVPVADWEPRVVCPQFQLQDDYSRASNTRLKLRALDFLSYIPMETEVVEPHANDETLSAAVGSEAVGHKTEEAAGGDESRDVTPPNFVASENATTAKPRVDDPLVGIRLRGNSNVEHVSMKCQHRSPTKYGHSNRRLVRSLRNQQEQQLINNGIHDSSRIFLSWEKAYPAMAFSVVKYDESSESKRKKKLRLSSVIMEMPRRRNEVPKILSDATWLKKRWGTSYARYFDPRWADASGDKVDPVKAAKEESWDRNYRANALDDTRIRQGKHRTVQSLDGYYFSFLPYTKKKDLKSELNELFREQHPDLPHDLTLSKIRNLKKEVLEHVRNVGLEMTTAALAIIYFEKLVFKGVVSKQNRKLVMSVCLVLAYKFNEKKNFQGSETLKKLLEDIERIQSLSPKQVLEAEFPVFGHLLFHLKVDTDEVMVHFSRLLKMTELNPITYLGEDLAKFFFPDDEEKNKTRRFDKPR